MKIDERVDDLRLWKKCVLLPRSSAVVGQISHRQKTFGWVESLKWAAGAHVHQEDACGAAPVRRAEFEVARAPRGGGFDGIKARIPASTKLPL